MPGAWRTSAATRSRIDKDFSVNNSQSIISPLQQSANFEFAFRLRQPQPAKPKACVVLLHGVGGSETNEPFNNSRLSRSGGRFPSSPSVHGRRCQDLNSYETSAPERRNRLTV